MEEAANQTTLPACPFCGHEADGYSRFDGEDIVWHTVSGNQRCRIAGINFTVAEWSSRRTASVGADAAASYYLVKSRDKPSDGFTLTIFIREDNAHGFAHDWMTCERSKETSEAEVIPLYIRSASPSSAAEICAEMAREAALEEAAKECDERAHALEAERGKSSKPTERRTLLAKSNVATGLAIRIRALRKAERRIRART